MLYMSAELARGGIEDYREWQHTQKVIRWHSLGAYWIKGGRMLTGARGAETKSSGSV